MTLRKYASDPSIRAMMGVASNVRFVGNIVSKSEDGKTIDIKVEMPDYDGTVRTQIKLTRARFDKVNVSDTIVGNGEFARNYRNEKIAMVLTPRQFVIRNVRGVQVV